MLLEFSVKLMSLPCKNCASSVPIIMRQTQPCRQDLLKHKPSCSTGIDGNCSDKALIGIFEDGESDMCGLLDVIKNHPQEGEWMLGLFLLAPDKRGQGFGRAFYLSFEKWAQINGAKTIRIGVIEHNSRALKFWRDLGFLEIERKSPYTFGKRESALLVLTRNCM